VVFCIHEDAIKYPTSFLILQYLKRLNTVIHDLKFGDAMDHDRQMNDTDALSKYNQSFLSCLYDYFYLSLDTGHRNI